MPIFLNVEVAVIIKTNVRIIDHDHSSKRYAVGMQQHKT